MACDGLVTAKVVAPTNIWPELLAIAVQGLGFNTGSGLPMYICMHVCVCACMHVCI